MKVNNLGYALSKRSEHGHYVGKGISTSGNKHEVKLNLHPTASLPRGSILSSNSSGFQFAANRLPKNSNDAQKKSKHQKFSK